MNTNNSYKQLQDARALELPTREAMLTRDISVQQFWERNNKLLNNAWEEWEQSNKEHQFNLDNSLFDERLQKAINKAWEDPNTEVDVRELWQEVAPDVYQCQFFDPEKLANLREYLEQIWDAQIPLRSPYGLVLNRRGAMLDKRSEGYLAAPSFQTLYRKLVDIYMRPISRLLFPEVMGFDTQTFGFSINYQPNADNSIRTHSDASAVTLNINLNLPDEEFTGSELDFFNPYTREKQTLSFKPGSAVIHRGNVPHAAQPILSGERTNFVLWLYGDYGRLPSHEAKRIDIDAKKRWKIPTTALDEFAPF